MNGTTNNYSPATISTVIYNGDGGSDTTTVAGLPGTPNTIFSPTLTSVSSVNYSYQINGSKSVYVYAARGRYGHHGRLGRQRLILRLANLQRHDQCRR